MLSLMVPVVLDPGCGRGLARLANPTLFFDVASHRNLNHVVSQRYQVERVSECNGGVDTAATKLRVRHSLYVAH